MSLEAARVAFAQMPTYRTPFWLIHFPAIGTTRMYDSLGLLPNIINNLEESMLNIICNKHIINNSLGYLFVSE
jgi:hypothetical protein